MSSCVQYLQIMEWPQGRSCMSGTLSRQIIQLSSSSSSFPILNLCESTVESSLNEDSIEENSIEEDSEGIESIGDCAFDSCHSLTAVSFPTTLTSIGQFAFEYCSNLEIINLLNTNLQELGPAAFALCSKLKSMTIPDSLQTLGPNVFFNCSKLVPSNIDVNDMTKSGETAKVVAYLHSQQSTP